MWQKIISYVHYNFITTSTSLGVVRRQNSATFKKIAVFFIPRRLFWKWIRQFFVWDDTSVHKISNIGPLGINLISRVRLYVRATFGFGLGLSDPVRVNPSGQTENMQGNNSGPAITHHHQPPTATTTNHGANGKHPSAPAAQYFI